jgi:hypothetical protein
LAAEFLIKGCSHALQAFLRRLGLGPSPVRHSAQPINATRLGQHSAEAQHASTTGHLNTNQCQISSSAASASVFAGEREMAGRVDLPVVDLASPDVRASAAAVRQVSRLDSQSSAVGSLLRGRSD